ncbi:unnamed protein product [Penicillium olsonii]|uniref:Uncharacterized protein n=1 Tax=Penicillium olsonii TaxID=99116 RepID=A0A9W4MS36_PENOL|nr:unnamed protein product [Penicillium olsonii]CAG8206314.1 unnamed protein product [Penicillium olsonii]
MGVVFIQGQVQVPILVQPPKTVIESMVHVFVVRFGVGIKRRGQRGLLGIEGGRLGRTGSGRARTATVSLVGFVGGVVDEARPIGSLQAQTLFGGEQLLLNLCGESMKALGVGLCGKVCQLQRAGFAKFSGKRGTFLEAPFVQAAGTTRVGDHTPVGPIGLIVRGARRGTVIALR